MQNWPRSNLDGLVMFWPNASDLEASLCEKIIGPGSGRMYNSVYRYREMATHTTVSPNAG